MMVGTSLLAQVTWKRTYEFIENHGLPPASSLRHRRPNPFSFGQEPQLTLEQEEAEWSRSGVEMGVEMECTMPSTSHLECTWTRKGPFVSDFMGCLTPLKTGTTESPIFQGTRELGSTPGRDVYDFGCGDQPIEQPSVHRASTDSGSGSCQVSVGRMQERCFWAVFVRWLTDRSKTPLTPTDVFVIEHPVNTQSSAQNLEPYSTVP